MSNLSNKAESSGPEGSWYALRYQGLTSISKQRDLPMLSAKVGLLFEITNQKRITDAPRDLRGIHTTS
ncbi:hypothetical protein LVD13_00175 [Flavobacteriaceae bacterium D16]|nr:hypothetical protein [Flavobacteriaceae bacterium D16]